MAGTGKTTIAYSLCTILDTTDQLSASFFCSRALPDCQDVARIVPTIAYQLAHKSHTFQATLCRTLGNDPDADAYDLETQVKKLLAKPLMDVKNEAAFSPFVIVIDALDECTDRAGAQLLLDILLELVRTFPVRFFITCRPEPYLLDKITLRGGVSKSIFHLHNIEESLVHADIETYLRVELEPLLVSTDNIKRLAELSGKLFIYASTAVRYIRSDTTPVNHPLSPKSKAYKTIDALYGTILSSVLDNNDLEPSEVETITLVLHTVVSAREPMTIETLANFLKVESVDDVRLALEPLRSVLHVSEANGLVVTLHASFPDYLLSRERSGRFYCCKNQQNQLLAQHCFSAMMELPRFTVRNLELLLMVDDDMPNLASRLDKVISTHLFYACRYWSDHLIQSECFVILEKSLEHFLDRQTLFWLEVMNMKGCIEACPRMMSETHEYLQSSGAPTIVCETVQDAHRYSTAIVVASRLKTTDHIYESVLSLWKLNGPIWQNISPSPGRFRDLAALAAGTAQSAVASIAISGDGTRVVSGCDDGSLWIWDTYTARVVSGPLRGRTTGTVYCVVFSPNGHHVVSGSDDHTICTWDTHSGHLAIDPFIGHTGAVTSIAMSSDGNRLVSGSRDCTIRVWDTHTGRTVAGPFQGHVNRVSTVAFSPDNKRVVSGSWDNTVRIWSVSTGQILAGPFIGHTDYVSTVAFSRDGRRVTSGSWDCTIRVWGEQNEQTVVNLSEELSSPVSSIAFSPDDTYVASGSWGGDILIWDAHTGSVVARSSGYHAGPVRSVSFTPDGGRIISGSRDRTVRIWNAQPGPTVAALFREHALSIICVALSSDGNRVASGSQDGTICLWNTHSGRAAANLPNTDHVESITSIAFSPADCGRIVSGSSHGNICIWDVQTGQTLCLSHTRSHSVHSVAFSLDGNFIVSGSWDRTVRIWNAHTGQTIAGPFVGYVSQVKSISLSTNGNHVIYESGGLLNQIKVVCRETYPAYCTETAQISSEDPLSHESFVVFKSNDHIYVWDPYTKNDVTARYRLNHGVENSNWALSYGSYLLLWIPQSLRERLKLLQNAVLARGEKSWSLQIGGSLSENQYNKVIATFAHRAPLLHQ
ncbi:hypothetical protein FRC12_002996 [Ceratobasidium sp. 428]|nr:hypothetical protein FRC12_002996 [Ceratobasidium sp. 428]